MHAPRSNAERTAVLVATIGLCACSVPPIDRAPRVDTVQVPTRDGTGLSTDLYFPADGDGPAPVILMRTPYNKDWHGDYGRYYAGHGYVVAIQDVRGRFASEGAWEPFVHEGRDGFDTVEWLAAQDWSTGKVGMIGGSYSGIAQFAAAAEHPPHLAALVPNITPAVPFDGLPYNGGILQLGWAIRWVDIMENAHTGTEFSDRLQRAIREDWAARLDRLPVVELDRAVVGREVDYWRSWIEHDTPDAYWDSVAHMNRLDSIDVPVLLQSGWFDGGTRGTRLAHRRLVAGGNRNVRMIVGPWTHSDRGSRFLNGADMGLEAEVDLFDRYRRWFDRRLREDTPTEDDTASVEVYLMGTNRWLRGDSYPLPDTTLTPFYLAPATDTTSPRIDGNLRRDPPAVDQDGVDTYVYDPMDPTPSFYAHLKRGALEAYHARIRSGRDAALYETPPLEEPLHLVGPVAATIHASSSARDTDWHVTLYGVAPGGRTYPIGLTFGALRAKFRESRTDPSLLEPGRVYAYEIDLGHTAVTVERGHRLRLEIASASFPESSRNLNTGEHSEASADWVVAEQSIHRGRRFRSCVTLPVHTPDDRRQAVTGEDPG